jgi:hypothetical protein
MRTLFLGTAAAVITGLLGANLVAQPANKAAAPLAGVPVFKADPKWPVLPPDFTWGR